MAISKEVTFVDATTVVDAAWLNLIQEHLAGLATLVIDTPTTTQVRVVGGSDDAVAALYIEGQQRFNDTSVAVSMIGEPAATYGLYATAPAGVDTFALEATTGTPGVSPYRKIADVVWNGGEITAVRVEGRTHDHSPTDGSGSFAHSGLPGLTTGDEHTQYIHKDGRRPFTAVVDGVTPTADDELATKGYIDGLVTSNPGLPIGAIIPYAGALDDIPGGWFLCDGSSKDTTTEAALFAVIGYAFGGAASSFTLPDFSWKTPLGKTVAGNPSTVGASGGAWTHQHTQATHTHSQVAHIHNTFDHTHEHPTTDVDGSHIHTQGSTLTNGAHIHSGRVHDHGAGTLDVPATGNESVGGRNASQSTAGLYPEDELDNSSSSTSHAHGDGSLFAGSPYNTSVIGTSGSTTKSHSHAPSGNSWQHTHAGVSVTGDSAEAGGDDGSESGDHEHTNPSFVTVPDHTHDGGTTGSASVTTDSGGGGATAAGGDIATSQHAPAYIRMGYIIRAS